MQSKVLEIEDLEIGDIGEQLLRQQSRGLRDRYLFVAWLRDMDNRLAHFEPLPSEILIENRFIGTLSQ